MRNKRTVPEKSRSPFLLFVLTFSGFLAYLAVFFQQPSALGFTSEDGQSLDRLTDLLVMPSMMQAVFSDGAQPAGLFDRVPLLLSVIGWCGIGYWIGAPVVGRALGLVRSFQSLSLSILAGWAILSTTTLVVGLAGGLGSRLPLTLAIVVIVAIAAVLRMKFVGETNADFTPSHSPAAEDLRPQSMGGVWVTRLIPVMTCLLAACYLLGSFVPPWEFDVLEYHLQAPKEFWQAGRIQFIDHNVYANMPLGAQMHSLAAMTLFGGESGWWWGGLFGKSIIGIHSLLAAMLVGSFVTQKFGKTCGWVSAGLMLASPGNAHVAMSGLIDMAFGAYLIAMLVTAEQGFSKLKMGQGRASLVFLLGLFAGSAAACKYTGLVFAVIPMFVAIVYIGMRFPPGRPLERAKRVCTLFVPFTLALGLTVVPWLVKNAAATGNPVFPLAYDLFGGRGLTDANMERWQRVHSPQPDDSGSAYGVGAVLKSSKQLLLTSPFINPTLVFLALVGTVASITGECRRWWLLSWLALLVWILAIWFLATHRIDRFWLPALPIVAVIAAVGVVSIARHISVGLASGIVFLGLGYGLLQVSSGAGPVDTRFFVPLADMERESREENSTGITNPATIWANRELSPGDRVLCIGAVQAYLYRIPMIYATCFNESPGERWLSDKPSAVQQKNLWANGVTHMIVSWKEIERYRSPSNNGYSDWPVPADIGVMVESGVLNRLATSLDPSEVEILVVNQRDE